MDINHLSRFRASIMGGAMILVIITHMPIPFEHVIPYFTSNCEIGVDVFLLLSGIGLAFSVRNGLDLKTFYAKRVLRIFPLYIIICLLDSVIYEKDIIDFLLMSTTIGYWLGGGLEWFIPFIVIMYALFPLLWWLLKRDNTLLYLAFILFVLSILLPPNNYYIIILRIPIFIYGIWIGRRLINTPPSCTYYRSTIILMIIGIVLSVYFYNTYYVYGPSEELKFVRRYGYEFLPFFLITPGLCLLLGNLLSYAPTTLCRLLAKVGEISLELYLLHPFFIRAAQFIYNNYFDQASGLKIALLISFIIILFPISYGLHTLLMCLTEPLKRRFVKSNKTPI